MIDVRVMAHPARTQQARHLADQVGAPIVWDQHNDEWDTAARAWASIDPDADWGLVLQDDALPIPDLLHHLQAGLTHTPRTCVSLYVGTGRPHADRVTNATRNATTTHASWLTHPMLMWGPAVLLPTEHIPPLLAWARHDHRPYDHRIGAYYRTRLRLPVRYTWPSLVDHDDTQPSLLGHEGRCVRHAHRVGIPTWNDRVVTIS